MEAPKPITKPYPDLHTDTALILPIARTILYEHTNRNFIEYEFSDGTYAHVRQTKKDTETINVIGVYDTDGYEIYAGPDELLKPPINFEALRRWRQENLPPPAQTEEELQDRVNKLLNTL